jgi:hypothetical protein
MRLELPIARATGSALLIRARSETILLDQVVPQKGHLKFVHRMYIGEAPSSQFAHRMVLRDRVPTASRQVPMNQLTFVIAKRFRGGLPSQGTAFPLCGELQPRTVSAAGESQQRNAHAGRK